MSKNQPTKHGGKRPGAGRRPGSKNKRTRALADAITEVRQAIDEGDTPLAYLLRVMRDAEQEQAVRIEAAKAAAPYVHPRLSNVEMTTHSTGETHDEYVLRRARERGLVKPGSTEKPALNS